MLDSLDIWQERFQIVSDTITPSEGAVNCLP